MLLEYVEDGAVVQSMYLSQHFARHQHVPLAFRVPLPERFPSWHDDVVYMCRPCFDEHFKALFGTC